jgi:hypothetical protein
MTDEDYKLEELGYCIEIPESLYQKMTRHVGALKSLEDRGYSNRRWAMEAIKEKLEEPSAELRKPPVLSIAFPKQLHKKIEEKIASIKALRKNFSKKKWILEAIYAKLDRDQVKIAKLLSESNQKNPIDSAAMQYACPIKSRSRKRSKKKVRKR